MPVLRRYGGSAVISRPPMMMRPRLGATKPATMRRHVVLPQPLGPSRVTNSPGCTVRSMPRTAS